MAPVDPVLFQAYVLLPFELAVPVTAVCDPVTFRMSSYLVTVFRPVESVRHASIRHEQPPPVRTEQAARPADPQKPDPDVLLDGVPTVPADLLTVQFRRSRFNRRVWTEGQDVDYLSWGDPSPRDISAAVNRWLFTLRTIARNERLVAIQPTDLVCLGIYLRESGEMLPHRAGFHRMKALGGNTVVVNGLPSESWKAVSALVGSYEPPAYETLLLDARALLPAVAPAVSLAYAGLEVFLDSALGQMPTARRLPSGYWGWQTARKRAPVPEEQLDSLLEVLCGHSLKKEKPNLWTAFRDLERARNSLVHTGTAQDANGAPVDATRAMALVVSAQQIVDWVESLLPVRARIPRSDAQHDLRFKLKLPSLAPPLNSTTVDDDSTGSSRPARP